MNKNIERIIRIAGKVAELAEKKARKEIYHLQKSGFVSKKEAKHAMKLAMKEAAAETERVKKFVMAELRRELKKAKPLIRKMLAQKKKQFMKYRKARKRKEH